MAPPLMTPTSSAGAYRVREAGGGGGSSWLPLGPPDRGRVTAPPAPVAPRTRATHHPGEGCDPRRRGGRVAHDAAPGHRVPAQLELGLEEGDDLGPRGDPSNRRHHQAEGDEREIEGDQARRLAGEGVQMAEVGPVEDRDPLILGQPGQELAVPDVDRVDPRRPRASSTSVKPPVDAPASRQIRPRQSTAKASRAAASFSPARLAHGLSSPSVRTTARLPHPLGGAAGPAAVDLHHPRRHHGLGALAGGGDSAFHQGRDRARCGVTAWLQAGWRRTEMGVIRRGSHRGRCPAARRCRAGRHQRRPGRGRRAARRSRARAPAASRRPARRLRPPAG